MKKALLLVFLLSLLLSNCSSLKKQLQAGEFQNTFEWCLYQVQYDKNPQPKYWQWLSQAHNELVRQDVRRIEALELEAAPDRWLALYPIYQGLAKRQQTVSPYLTRLQSYDLVQAYSPTTLVALIERARVASGRYCQKQSQLLLPEARTGDKTAARKGYQWIERAAEYIPEETNEFKPQRDELFDLATVRVVIEMIEPSHPDAAEQEVFQKIVEAQGTFWRDGWLEVHFAEPADQRIDYYATGEVVDAYCGPEEEYVSAQTYTDEIVVGYTTEREEVVEGDNTIIVETDLPMTRTVSANVTTVEQYKQACSGMNVLLFDALSDTVVQEWSLQDCDEWSNVFETCQGDQRALSAPCSGIRFLYPSEATLLRGTARGLRSVLEQRLKKQFEDYLERSKRQWATS